MNIPNVGDEVNLAKWDRTVRAEYQHGKGVVTGVRKDRHTESGVICTIKTFRGEIELDPTWLTPII